MIKYNQLERSGDSVARSERSEDRAEPNIINYKDEIKNIQIIINRINDSSSEPQLGKLIQEKIEYSIIANNFISLIKF